MGLSWYNDRYQLKPSGSFLQQGQEREGGWDLLVID